MTSKNIKTIFFTYLFNACKTFKRLYRSPKAIYNDKNCISRIAYGVLSLPYAMTSTSSLDDALWVILTKRSAKILRCMY